MYSYKDNTYEVLTEARMKNPLTREWQECVIYKQHINGNIYVREKDEFYTLFNPIAIKIPYHIEAMANLVNVVNVPGNEATGEVRRFEVSGFIPRKHQVVSHEIIHNEDYDALWIHIANNYFKMIGLWPSPIM